MDPSECGVCRSLITATPLWQDELWHVRQIDPPIGVPGWMMLIAKRHVGGPAHFNEAEARSFGLTLRHLEKVLEEVSGALRIYTAAMGESWPHFHCHMVPRLPTMPKDAKGWAVFDLQRAAQSGEIVPDPSESARIERAYRDALSKQPPPR
jgi:diadenosine tetraphosphate (Ap4A) HIT family hydrolase